MSDAKTLNVALIGYQFMGKAHSNAWLSAAHYFDLPVKPVLHTLAGRTLAPLAKCAATWGWRHHTTSLREIYENPEIDLIDVGVPNDAHPDIVCAAAEAGKAIACEKPLARTYAEAKVMHAVVKKARVKNYVWFNYRRVPAVEFARQLVAQGRIGRIFHIRGLYLQDWIKSPDFPWVWRLSKKVAGSGSHGDLAAHSIDMLRHITGDEITEVSGMFNTFIKERPEGRMTQGLSGTAGGKGRKVKVDVDDAVLFLCRTQGGAVGTFEATRFATGHHNTNSLEINGDKGSLRFNFANFSELEFFDDTLPPSEKGWRTISVTTAHHDYASAYWPAGHHIGYGETFTNTAADIVRHMADPKAKPAAFHANFDDGLACQRVLEAVTRSAQEGRWVEVKEIQ